MMVTRTATFSFRTVNPFNGIDVGTNSSPRANFSPSFADIDGDGDLDLVIGELFGALHYYENTGSSSAPAYTGRGGTASPFNGIDAGLAATPSFGDFDIDGDLDLVIGNSTGTLHYYENTGSSSAPAYTGRSGTASPFNGIDVLYNSSPSFGDIDGDGDLNLVVGNAKGTLYYYENTGSSSAPAYTGRGGTASPFNGIDVGSFSSPSFADIDGDGDLDLVVGNVDGILNYYENTGSSSAPAYTGRGGTANPFNGIHVGENSSPSFADIDGDGDLDLVDGVLFSILNYYENITRIIGTTANDVLTGALSTDIMEGGADADTLEGRAGADSLDGGVGTDTASYAGSTMGVTVSLVAGATNSGGDAAGDVLNNIENLTGSVHNDTLTGDTAANRLSGGDGLDVLNGGAGADTLDGGAGSDTASYAGSAAAVNVSLVAGAANTGGDAAGDVLSGVEDLVGSAHNDTLTGDADANQLTGGYGDDTLIGGGGDDILLDFAGHNTFVGGAGWDVLHGGWGVDTASYAGSAAAVNVSLVAGAANTGGHAAGDMLSGVENLLGSAHNDTLTGDAGANHLSGGTGNDTLKGGRGNDTLISSAGTNTFEGGVGADVLTGGAGIDTASYAGSAAAVNVSLVGGASNTGGDAAGDMLSGVENLVGSAHNDTLTGNTAANHLSGGAGTDTASYAGSSAGVNVSLVAGASNTGGDAAGDTFAGIENLVGSAHNDALTGDTDANTLDGGAGADTLDGGAGSDTASYAGSSAAVNVSLVGGASNTGGDAAGDTFAGIENLLGSAHNDTLTGNAGANHLSGGAGTDTASYAGSSAGVNVSLVARAANTGGDAAGDVLSGIEDLVGSAHNDTLTGDADANQLSGGAGSDTASYAGSSAAVNVSLVARASNTGGDAAGDVLSGIENLVGSAHNDALTGDADANTLDGGAGADTLDGGAGADTASYAGSSAGVNVSLVAGASNTGGDAAGDVLSGVENLVGSAHNDTLTGGAGANHLSGGAGTDTASYAGSSAGVNVSLVAGASNTGGDAAGDVLSGIENLVGSAHNDTLTGDAGANHLTGGAGSDTASYAGSSAAVNVSLVDGASNTGGEAAGDVLSGIENLVGSAHNDTLTGGADANHLSGGAGTDTASYAGSSAGVNVSLVAGASNTGGDAAGDVLSGVENLVGSAHNDTLSGGEGANHLSGGAGTDTASYAGSSAAVNVSLVAGASNTGGDAAGDVLSGVENLVGSAHNDTLTGGAGANHLSGGAGTDTASYAGSSAGVNVSLVAGASNTGGDAAGDTFAGIENILGSAHNDALTGDTDANTLDGGAGADTLDGGAGTDTASYAGSAAAVNVSLVVGASNTGGEAAGDVLSGIENLVGSAHNDTLTGNADANHLSGGAGTDTASYAGSSAAVNVSLVARAANTGGDAAGDTLAGIEDLVGSAHNDTLTGDADANQLTGGAGADTLDGGAGTDTASYAGSAAAVNVSLEAGAANTGGDAAGDMLSGVENLVGSAHNDTLTGNTAANHLSGGAGTDTASYAGSAAAVNVSLVAGASNTGGDAAGDTFAGIENLVGSAHNDALTGDTDANTLDGRAGADTLDGGAGSDTASYAGSSAAVNVSLVGGASNTGGDAAGDVLSGVENLLGSAHNDTLTGDAGANRLIGGDGNDTLKGGRGNDTLISSAGTNTFEGGVGADVLTGGAGIDTASYVGSAAAVNVSLVGGASNTGGDAAGDTFAGIENLVGSAHNDTLTGNTAANHLSGGAGTDTASYAGSSAGVNVSLVAGASNTGGDAAGDTLAGIENLLGSAHNDALTGDTDANTLDGGAGADTLDGRSGTDTVSYAGSSAAVNVSLVAGAANTGGDAAGDVLSGFEVLVGSAHNDTLTGNADANQLTGGAGADTLDGGAGLDMASYDGSSAGVNVSLVAGAANTGGDAAGDVLSGIEDLVGSAHNDTLTGDADANQLTGGYGGDTLIGGGGDDILLDFAGHNTFVGGAGMDVLQGGWGVDTASYAGSAAAVNVSLVAGAANTGGDAAGDVLSGVEDLVGSAHNDTLTGDAGANHLSGGAGADTLDGRSGTDTVSYAGSSAAVNVSLVAGAANTGGDAAGDVLSGFEVLVGSAHNDTLTGNAGANYLTGGAGTDTASYAGSSAAVNVNLVAGASNTGGDAAGDVLSGIENLVGSAHNDTLTGDADANHLSGGAGADTLTGGAGTDTASYAGSSAGVNVSLVASASNTGGDAAGDVLSGVENLVGSAHNDTLTGDAGANHLSGGAGADTLTGAAGTDTASYAGSSAGVNVSLVAGASNTGGDAAGDVLSGVENLLGSAHNDTLTGDADANHLSGGAGTDTASYAGSSAGVNVSLVAGASNTGGDAAGDVLSGVENLVGSAHNDTLTGDADANHLSGGAGADTLTGAAGTDTASYAGSSAGVNVSLVAGASNTGGDAAGDVLSGVENLVGSAHNDTLTGDADANHLSGGAGADTLTGAAGTDTASYAGSSAGVSVNLASGATSGGDAQGDVLSGVENLRGTAQRDSLIGDGGSNTLEGGAGADTLDGGAGTDTVSYANASSSVTVSLVGGASNTGDAAGDAFAGIENILGSAHNDTLTGDADANHLSGGAGADTLTGGAGTDTASYAGSSAGVNVSLVAGASNTGGDAAGDVLSGVENLVGSAHNDTLTGDADANHMSGGAGADTLTGGAGTDTASYAGSSAGVNVSLFAGASNTGGDAAGDAFAGIENILGSAHNDTLTGDTAANRLIGGPGDDSLYGGDGADRLYGGDGNDTLDAGSVSGATWQYVYGAVGNDTYRYSKEDNNVYVAAAAETATSGTADAVVFTDLNASDVVWFGYQDYTATYSTEGMALRISWQNGTGASREIQIAQQGQHIESYTFADGSVFQSFVTTNDQNQTLTGTAQNNFMHGNSGADILLGQAGADRLMGGAGSDLLEGGAGADVIVAGSGIDTASYAGSSAGVSVNLASGAISGGDAQGDVLSGVENILGSAHNDTLTGDTAANRLNGGDGNDTLNGGDGADRLYGGDGNDTLTGDTDANTLEGGAGADTLAGGTGIDMASYDGSAAAVNVSLVAGANNTGGDAAGDVLSGVENLLGSAYHDTLTGDTAANRLIGGDGNDALNGGDGADRLYGGDGNDTLDAGSVSGATWQYVYGESGNDTYRYSKEDNNVYVAAAAETATSGTADAVVFTDLNASDVVWSGYQDYTATYSNEGKALRIAWQHGTGGSREIQIAQQGQHIESYTFADGSVFQSFVTTNDQNQTLTGTAQNNFMHGNSGADTLLGQAGADRLVGGAGSDLLEGGAGADVIVAGSGIDTASYAGSSAGVSVSLASGAISGGDAQGDVLSGVENLLGSAHSDTLTGDTAANRLIGGDGNDTLNGGDGADQLYGGDGNDTLNGDTDANTLEGGAGADVIVAGSGIDMASYDGSSAAVDVSLVAGASNTGGDAAGDVLSGVENLLGSAHNDTLTGDTAANRLIGGGGNDTLNGGDGADRLYGGDGNDTLDAGSVSGATWQYVFGAAGNDTYRYSQSSGNVFVASESASTGTADQFVFTDLSLGQISFDTIDYGTSYGGNIGMAVRLRWNESGTAREAQLALEGQHIETYAFTGGTTVNRFIVAGASDTTLSGTSGNDVIVGNGLANTFTGGAGDDVFVFEAGFGADTIADFNASNAEKIDLTEISGITDFVDLTTNHLSDNSGTARITLDSGNTIDLTGITVGQIGTALDYSADDFLF